MSQEIQEIIVEINPETLDLVGPIERSVAHNYGVPHAVVFAFLASPANDNQPIENLLVQVRSANKKYPGAVTAAASGHIAFEEGKTLKEMARESVIRELEEETGLSDIPLELIAIAYHVEPGDAQLMYIYLARMDVLPDLSGVKNSEVSEMKIISARELLQLVKEGKTTPFSAVAIPLLGIRNEV